MSVVKSGPSPINNFEAKPTRSTSRTNRRQSDPRPAGRYDGRTHNLKPQELAKPRRGVKGVTAAVIAPWGDGRTRVPVTVNRRVDILEEERSNGRISEAAYQTGRMIQATFEKLGSVGGSNWAGGSRVDAESAQEAQFAKLLDNQKLVQGLKARIRDRLGDMGFVRMCRIVRDGLSFAEYAAFTGKSGDWGRRFVAEGFRSDIEYLAEAWGATGKVAATPEDKYRAESRKRAAAEFAKEDAQASVEGST